MAVHKVGDVRNPEAKCLRIVHVSDTHTRHNDILASLPEGDILIHSGDFLQHSIRKHFSRSDFNRAISEIDSFFQRAPFKHKILVAGNHDVCLEAHGPEAVQARLQHAIYLQDSSVTIEGIKIYGSPWTALRWTHALAFTRKMSKLRNVWEKIPLDTDILVTHMPPLGVLDVGLEKFRFLNVFSLDEECMVCNQEHADYCHWGSPSLMQTVLTNVKPKLHLFGHVHEGSGVKTVDGIVFSNAAWKLKKKNPVQFHYYTSAKTEETDTT